MRDLNLNGLKAAITSRIVTFANKLLANGSNNFFQVKGNFPSVPTHDLIGVTFNFLSSGNANFTQYGVFGGIGGTYTGTFPNVGAFFYGASDSSAGPSIGLISYAENNSGTGGALGAWFQSPFNTGAGGSAVGMAAEGGRADIQPSAAAIFYLSNAFATAVPAVVNSSVVIIDTAGSSAFTVPLLRGRDGGVDKFILNQNGSFSLNRTITAAGTTGAQTINKPAGTVNFAAGAGVAGLVVTNSLVTASSIIFLTIRTNDTTLKSVISVAAAGSFTIFANANATAETSVGFLVTN